MGKQINNTIQSVLVPPLAKGLLHPQMELSSIKLMADHLQINPACSQPALVLSSALLDTLPFLPRACCMRLVRGLSQLLSPAWDHYHPLVPSEPVLRSVRVQSPILDLSHSPSPSPPSSRTEVLKGWSTNAQASWRPSQECASSKPFS